MKRIPLATLDYPFPHKFDAGKYNAHYLLSRVPENVVQKSILDLLWRYHVDAIAIDAGLKTARRKFISKALAFGLDGTSFKGGLAELPAGHSDLAGTLAPAGRSLYIEVKAPAWIDERGKVIRSAGKPTTEQLDFLLSKYDRGAIALVAYSVDDVSEFLGKELIANFNATREVRR